MPGASDYTVQNVLNYLAGSLTVPSMPQLWMALFTTAPSTDSGTSSGTEVTGGSYARQQIAGTLTTNGTTASGNATLHFASVPSWIVAGMLIRDQTTASVIPAATTVLSTTSTTVVMSANATGGGVGGTDVITFSAFAAASASSSSNATIAPGSIVNSSAVVTFPQATVSWGTVVAFGIFDSSAATTNLLYWDWLGNFKWIPFTMPNASSVLTTDASGDVPANSSLVVVQQKYGGTLPTLSAGSWTGTLTTSAASGATFTIAANTSSSTGAGLFRQVQSQSIPANVTASFAANQLVVSLA